MNSSQQTVFIVDDDAAILKALSRLLGAVGFRVSTYGSPQTFLEAFTNSARGCVVLDLTMPELDGIQLQQALIAKNCTLPIIFLTGNGDIPTSVQAMKHGAIDFLTKPVDDEALIAAVRQAFEQEEAHHEIHAEVARLRERITLLTPREREVLGHVLAGRLNKQTADMLGTTEKTVKVHRARIMEKMNAQSVAELVRLAGEAGITPTP